MARALREYQVLGIRTTIPFFLWLMRQPDYHAGRYDTTYLDRLGPPRRGGGVTRARAARGGGRGELLVPIDGRLAIASVNKGRTSGRGGESGTGAAGEQAIVAPTPGQVVRVLLAAGGRGAARQGAGGG